jgi:hypothetical protein
MVAGLRESERVGQLLSDEIGLAQQLSTLTDRNSTSCFQNQLFLIAEAVREKAQKS